MRKLLSLFASNDKTKEIIENITKIDSRVNIRGLSGSSLSFYISSIIEKTREFNHIFLFSNKDIAGYFNNDLEEIFSEKEIDYTKKNILFYPSTYKRPYQEEEIENANILLRSEALKRLSSDEKPVIITYPKALSQKVISNSVLKKNTLKISKSDTLSMDFLIDVLDEYEFERVDFVSSAGEYSVRGGIVDVFSFSDENPYRIEFFSDEIESLRTFDILSQLTIEEKDNLTIIPNIQNNNIATEKRVSLLEYFGKDTIFWVEDIDYCLNEIDKEYEEAKQVYSQLESQFIHLEPDKLYNTSSEIKKDILNLSIIEIGSNPILNKGQVFEFNTEVQPSFNKDFTLLCNTLNEKSENSYTNIFCVENPKQEERIEKIIKEFSSHYSNINLNYFNNTISKGFIDNDLKICVFTDHELFERYHRYKLRDRKYEKEALTIKDILLLKPGDFVTHVDYGVGRFSGLEKLNNNGKIQESIRLIYKDNDILYISIHSLHKISRYVGKEGTSPSLHRLGSNTWQNLKDKTKQRVKDIAKDLIALYAKRKTSSGYAYSADSYLQNELEASFIYEDTPDQYKATKDVKNDMESSVPMDRLICGDVGFGKTEIAIRAAFKAVADSKQVAVLVPTTILAFQHFKSFTERLSNLPCRVDYINRFRSARDKTQIKNDLKSGKIDILIGTHAIANKSMEFKDLGLLIVDEEHKFGVSIKEKLKEMKVNVDTLTLTATPIPRTLQFSLMGARDLSVINTPPPNRIPIHTEIREFNKEIIRDAILREISRKGQVYFVHNRVQNINEIAGMVQELVPQAKILIGHGQMKGEKLEEIMLSFIEGEADVLIATTIVENGLDIPRANTIIINDAQNYGLSDLHQLRGRVGRSNKKAYAYLLVPALLAMTEEARKRLKAIEEFSNIGSGFNIAMRDLDIRGAGNILGAEQSGFISEIGYDMYHKILNEAIEELKENEFKDIYKEELSKRDSFVRDCVIETDLEVLIPDNYVTNIVERLNLYKELDGLESDLELEEFSSRLRDRFGNIPDSTLELIETIRLRRFAKKLGFEKLILKNDRLIGSFISNKDSEFFNTKYFSNILLYAQSYPNRFQLKERNDKLSLEISNIKSISSAYQLLNDIIQIS